uniref:Ig-like domain-containing protein n=1 Tax=Labrus bergylta TaxID=56723 RepID=A0A3Q3EXE2_9LABR
MVAAVSWKTGWTVMEGQKMILTCNPQCNAHRNSNPGYIWYKNKKRLKDSGANVDLLSFESIRNEDSGSYVCAMIGQEDLPSTAVNISVRRKQSDPVLSTRTPTKDSVPILTHTTENTEQTFNISQQPQNRGLFKISMILLSSVCVGLITGLTVTVLVYKVKQKKKMRRCADSANKPPAPNNDVYMALHIGHKKPQNKSLKKKK